MIDRTIPISKAAWEYLDEAVKKAAKHYGVKYTEKDKQINTQKILTGKQRRNERRKQGM